MQFDTYQHYKITKRIVLEIQKEVIQNTENHNLEEIEESYECDTKFFWNLVNRKEKQTIKW